MGNVGTSICIFLVMGASRLFSLELIQHVKGFMVILPTILRTEANQVAEPGRLQVQTRKDTIVLRFP